MTKLESVFAADRVAVVELAARFNLPSILVRKVIRSVGPDRQAVLAYLMAMTRHRRRAEE